MRALLLFFLCTLQTLNAQQSFTATIHFGHSVPVFTWDGSGSPLEYACQVLDSSFEKQGTLVILGRDKESVWYMESGYSNDASEESYFIYLERADTTGTWRRCLNKSAWLHDTTFHEAFVHMFGEHFSTNRLHKLIPVETWKPAREYEWVAQVNSKELDRCFEWNLDVTDDPDDGSCVFFFKWTTELHPFQQKRYIGFHNCVFAIPSDWKYYETETTDGYVADGRDTLHCKGFAALAPWPYQRKELVFNGREDSILHAGENERIRHYNDSLRTEFPLLLTHVHSSEVKDDSRVTRIVPREGVTGKMYMGVYSGSNSFVLTTTALTPEKQKEWMEMMMSAEWR